MRRAIVLVLLACLVVLDFDLAAAQAAKPEQTFGTWTLRREADPMTDRDRSIVFTDSDTGGTFGVRCDGASSTEVVLALGGYFGGDDNDKVRVELRWDSDPVLPYKLWDLSTNNSAVFAPAPLVPEILAQAKKAQQRVTIRATDPLDGDAVVHAFGLIGFTDALATLRCASPQPPS